MSAWNLLFNIFGIIVASLIILIGFFKKRYSYWKNLGVEYLEPSIPFGNARDNFYQIISTGEWFENFYHIMKSRKVKHAGSYFFHQPVYVPIDLDLIKQIMQVDFTHFTDHGAYVNEKDDPLSAHVFSLEGQRWRNLRMKLTPTFTSGKMKNMLPIMIKISKELIRVLEKESQNNQPVDAKDISARLTTDIIGNCAFGIDCNSLHDPNAEFRVYGKRLFNLTRKELIMNFLCFLFPTAMKLFGVKLFPGVATDFFWNVIKDTTEYREKNNVRRNDALQLLLDMKNNEGKESDSTLTFNELAAQAFVFFIGGFETSSTLMSFALLELALNEDVQDKLRKEVNTVLERNNNEFTYEALSEMKYLDMVIHETLRKHPPIPALARVCTKDYRVPNTDIFLKKGHTVFIPIRGIHYDPDYYQDPQKFDPTRFTEENKSKRHQFSFLPFGEGPRMCLETLRKYPPLPILTRVCTQDYRVPNTDLLIKKGDLVFIPIQGIHYDPEYYPDSKKFDPTRFSEENRSTRHQYSFLPFGEGPRLCIGLRFGLMQVRVGLSMVIKNFKIKLNPQTKLPIKVEPAKFLTSVEGNLWVDLEKIN